MGYVDFGDFTVLELFCFAENVFDGDCVFVCFCVDYVLEDGFSVEDDVEFAHSVFNHVYIE